MYLIMSDEDLDQVLDKLQRYNQINDTVSEVIQCLVQNVRTLKRESEVLNTQLKRAEKALKSAGYEDCGGMEWKPPLGPNPFKQRLYNELVVKLAKRFSNYPSNNDFKPLIDQLCCE